MIETSLNLSAYNRIVNISKQIDSLRTQKKSIDNAVFCDNRPANDAANLFRSLRFLKMLFWNDVLLLLRKKYPHVFVCSRCMVNAMGQRH